MVRRNAITLTNLRKIFEEFKDGLQLEELVPVYEVSAVSSVC